MIFGYWELFFIDMTIWIICLGLMLRFGGLTGLHPASLYFFFHAYTFTFRLFQLANGAPTMFANTATFLPVMREEIQRASFIALASLLIMTFLWLYLANKSKPPMVVSNGDIRYRPFSKRLMWMIISVTLPIGLISMILLRGSILVGASVMSLGVWVGSSYLISASQWFGISLLALIFYYGFRWTLLIPFLLYVIIGLLTFPFRTMVIIPGMFIVFTYLRRNGLKWPTLKLTLPIITMVFLFIAGKELGPQLRQGDFSGAWNLLVRRTIDMEDGTHVDAMFMDQMAVALSQIDDRNQFYYGGTYANLLLLPIPRAFWPDKPGQADWQKEIQTTARPTGEMGAIVTAFGEAYANFGYLGIVLYAMVIAVFSYRLYFWMLRSPYYSLVNFWSLSVYAILIQVFRDGLVSFVTFQVTMLMPLTLITFLHLISLRRRISEKEAPIRWATIFHRRNAYLDDQGRTRYRLYRSGLNVR